MSKRSGLPLNVLVSVSNAGAGIGIALITTPLVLNQVGTAGYGVWTIAQSFVLYLAIAEQGFGPAAQRYVAVSIGGGDLRAAARIMWTTLAGYLLIGLAAMGLLLALADPIVGLFDFPADLHEDAVDLVRLVGVTLPLALVAAGLGNVQAGLERFPGFAAATVSGSLTYLALLLVLVAGDASLYELGFAVLGQQLVMLIMRIVALRDVIGSGPPALVTRAETAELLRFSGKLQVAVMSLLINGQSDRVVVGLVAPASTVGQFGIAAQYGEAGRLVSASAIAPAISRLSATHGSGDRDRLYEEFRLLNRLWLLTVIGATAIGVASVYPTLTAWLGDGYGEAVEFGIVLVLAYGIGSLNGTRIAYLRAINQIGLEVRVGILTTVLNIALTVPLAIAFGPFGVVAGTLGAYTVGAAWLIRRFDEYAPPVPAISVRTLIRAVAIASLAAALVLGWGALMVSLLPAPVALAPVALGLVVALLGYLSGITGQRLTVERLRRWMMGRDLPLDADALR